MKSNDDIPEDEMLLAEAICAARVSRLKFGTFHPFTNRSQNKLTPDECTHACVLGALHFAGVISMTRRRHSPLADLTNAVVGNDSEPDEPWTKGKRDLGESLGYAYRCAMKDE